MAFTPANYDAIDRILAAVGLKGKPCRRVILDIQADALPTIHVYADVIADEEMLEKIAPALESAVVELHRLRCRNCLCGLHEYETVCPSCGCHQATVVEQHPAGEMPEDLRRLVDQTLTAEEVCREFQRRYVTWGKLMGGPHDGFVVEVKPEQTSFVAKLSVAESAAWGLMGKAVYTRENRRVFRFCGTYDPNKDAPKPDVTA